jgi:hypothetical protein
VSVDTANVLALRGGPMPTIVRLWERQEAEGLMVSVLERSDAELDRVAFVGKTLPKGPGAVFDVTVEIGKPLRREAEAVLLLSRKKVEPTDDKAGAVARARKAVQSVALPAAPARIKRGSPVATTKKEG